MTPQPQSEAENAACPVVHDYDHFVGGRAPLSGFREFDDLAAAHGPIFRTTQGQGYYVLTDYESILAGLQDPSTFSSGASIPTEPDPAFRMVPLHLDPPEHTLWRRLLGGYFSPARTKVLSGAIRERAVSIIDELVDKGACNYQVEFARVYPTSIFLEIFGLPVSELDRFMAWEDAILHGTSETDPGRVKATQAAGEVSMYLNEVLETRAAGDKGDDLISDALTWQINGAPVDRGELLNCLLLLFMAGLDTVASQLGYTMYHLATHEADRRAIAESPELIPNAVEELLRAFSITSMSRKVVKDTEIAGCPVKAGDMVVFPLTAADRDSTVYSSAATVDIRRENIRHLSFGAGPHRCLGSHLARAEMTIALEEWHRRIPEYSLDATVPITEHSGGLYGIDRLPLVW